MLLNATLLPGERDALLADARPALTVTDEAELAALGEGPPVDLADHLLGRPMHYTSGTSGRPKGVWCGVWDEGTARRAADDEADLWGFGPDDVHLVCSPMYHSVSTRFALGTLLRGGTCVILGRFDAELALGALTGAAGPVPTTTFVAPAALQRLLALGDALPDRFDSLRLLVHAGSPCPPPVKRQAMDRVADGVVWEFLGSTEGQFTACPAEEWVRRPGTVGRARPGRRLEVDEAGVVWCHAPDFAAFAYWDDPVKTAAAWRGDAFTVGDLGHLDADGFLYLEGRRDDLIISGGVNVYPAEIEAALSEVPGVAQVAVFGVDDETWGQRVCAAVVADPGAGRRTSSAGPSGRGPPTVWPGTSGPRSTSWSTPSPPPPPARSSAGSSRSGSASTADRRGGGESTGQPATAPGRTARWSTSSWWSSRPQPSRITSRSCWLTGSAGSKPRCSSRIRVPLPSGWSVQVTTESRPSANSVSAHE